MLLYKGASLPLRIPQLEANYADGFGGGVGGPDGRGAQVSGGGGDSRRRASEGVGHPVPQRPHPQRRLPPTVRATPTINPSPSLPVLSIRLCRRPETWTQTRNRQSFKFVVVALQRIWSICVYFSYLFVNPFDPIIHVIRLSSLYITHGIHIYSNFVALCLSWHSTSTW
jgi:hypothetical protein